MLSHTRTIGPGPSAFGAPGLAKMQQTAHGPSSCPHRAAVFLRMRAGLVALALVHGSLLGATFARAHAPVTMVELTPTHDSCFDTKSANAKGNKPYILVGGRYTGLVAFDTSPIPVTAIVRQAKLRLFLMKSRGPSGSAVGVHRIIDPWDEHIASGAAQPYIQSAPESTNSIGGTLDFIEWDLTSVAQLWVEQPGTNYGVALSGSFDGTVRLPSIFCPGVNTSRAYGSRWPVAFGRRLGNFRLHRCPIVHRVATAHRKFLCHPRHSTC